MKKHIPTKLKITFKRLLGKCVYTYTYFNRKIKSTLTSSKSGTAHHRKLSLKKMKKWEFVLLSGMFILSFYYGFGALISSKIYNRLDVEHTTNIQKGKNTPYALLYIIKTQVDDQAWTPALPLIFPASILDNLPNFQLGAKDTANLLIKKVAKKYNDANLSEAGLLLDYAPDIWLFSQNKDEKLSPGSAKQYRKALSHIEKSVKQSKDISVFLTTTNFLYLLKSANTILSQKINQLNGYVQEHSSEIMDFKADDIFYTTQGSAYTLHYFLSALSKDYQNQILAAEQYEEVTSALKFLSQAVELSPVAVKNASTSDIYEANHLLYLAYYLSQAQNKLQQIYYNVLLKSLENKNAN